MTAISWVKLVKTVYSCRLKTAIFRSKWANSRFKLAKSAQSLANSCLKLANTPVLVSCSRLREWAPKRYKSEDSSQQTSSTQPCDLEVLLQTPKPRKIQRRKKVTQKWLLGLRPKWFKSYLKVTQKKTRSDFSDRFSYFWVTFKFESLWPEPQKSLLSHFFVSLNFSGFRGL